MKKTPDKTDCLERCPNCKSDKVAGLVASFWTSVNSGEKVTWESESELGPERRCAECDHEWVDGL